MVSIARPHFDGLDLGGLVGAGFGAGFDAFGDDDGGAAAGDGGGAAGGGGGGTGVGGTVTGRRVGAGGGAL
jgi:hypothetical protein